MVNKATGPAVVNSGAEQKQIAGRGSHAASTLPDARDNLPVTRWCRFATVYCRCGIEPDESAQMHVCARHYLMTDEAVGGRG